MSARERLLEADEALAAAGVALEDATRAMVGQVVSVDLARDVVDLTDSVRANRGELRRILRHVPE